MYGHEILGVLPPFTPISDKLATLSILTLAIPRTKDSATTTPTLSKIVLLIYHDVEFSLREQETLRSKKLL